MDIYIYQASCICTENGEGPILLYPDIGYEVGADTLREAGRFSPPALSTGVLFPRQMPAIRR